MDEFENMILNVRNSFRLLYSFNKAIFDLMKYIGTKFSIPYAGGFSQFSSPPPTYGYTRFDRWAWDWLNLYLYEFDFAKDKIKFSIILQCDTGMWDTNVKHLDIEKFEKTKKSKTKLIFVFNNDEYWEINKVLEHENLKGKYTETFEITENKKSMFCMVFNINEFKDKTSTDNSLNKFVQYLNKNKIFDIKMVDKNL